MHLECVHLLCVSYSSIKLALEKAFLLVRNIRKPLDFLVGETFERARSTFHCAGFRGPTWPFWKSWPSSHSPGPLSGAWLCGCLPNGPLFSSSHALHHQVLLIPLLPLSIPTCSPQMNSGSCTPSLSPVSLALASLQSKVLAT